MADQKTPLEDLLTAAVIGGGFNILQQFPVVGFFFLKKKKKKKHSIETIKPHLNPYTN